MTQISVSFEDITDINKEYLFSYEENGFVYSFDINLS